MLQNSSILAFIVSIFRQSREHVEAQPLRNGAYPVNVRNMILSHRLPRSIFEFYISHVTLTFSDTVLPQSRDTWLFF